MVLGTSSCSSPGGWRGEWGGGHMVFRGVEEGKSSSTELKGGTANEGGIIRVLKSPMGD